MIFKEGNMEFEIKKSNYDDAIDANDLLTKLIADEKKYDKNINENCVVKSLYEKFYNQKDVCLYVAKYNNTTIGYVYGYIQNNGDCKNNIVCTLDALYVLKEYRNNGVATELINSFIKWSKGKNAYYIDLKVCNLNENAIKIYKKFGFYETKVIMTKNMEEL